MKKGDGWQWVMIAGAAAAAFYLLFRKTAPTAAEVFMREQERPQNVAGPNKYENAMPPAAMIPKNASIATDVANPHQASGAVPNPFKDTPKDSTIGDGLPPGFSGSFDDDPEAADLDGAEEDAPEPEEEA